MDPITIKKYYDQAAESYDEHRKIPPTELEALHQFVIMLRENGISDVVDFGCGTGAIPEILAVEGLKVSAFDLSEEMITTAIERHSHPNIIYSVSTFSEYLNRWNPSTPVGVVLAYSLVHTPYEEIHQLFYRLNNTLAIGSYLFVGLHIGDEARIPSSLNGEVVTLTAWDQNELQRMLAGLNLKTVFEKIRSADSWEFNNQKLCLILKTTEKLS